MLRLGCHRAIASPGQPYRDGRPSGCSLGSLPVTWRDRAHGPCNPMRGSHGNNRLTTYSANLSCCGHARLGWRYSEISVTSAIDGRGLRWTRLTFALRTPESLFL